MKLDLERVLITSLDNDSAHHKTHGSEIESNLHGLLFTVALTINKNSLEHPGLDSLKLQVQSSL